MSVLHIQFRRLLMVVCACRPGVAQQQRPFPDGISVIHPERIWNLLLEEETAEEQRALARVPISTREEQQYGNRAADALLDLLRRQGIGVQWRGRDVDYLRELTQVIRPQMRNQQRYRSLKIVVARSDATNAIAFPGGTLVVSEGMLDVCGSEAALVGVLGHELSHLDHGHALRIVRRIKLAQQSLPPPKGWETMLTDGMTLLKGFLRPFRPEDESQADLDGATWAYQAGYDPREMSRLLEWMAGRDPPRMHPLLQSHPDSMRRARAVRQKYDELVASEPRGELYVGRENLQRRIPRSQREWGGAPRADRQHE